MSLMINNGADIPLEKLYVNDYWIIDKYFGDRLWGWGMNAYGSLGDNTNVQKISPVQTITGGTNWKQVTSGYSHTAAIKTDGTLWMWGNNTYGQLGDTSVAWKSSPVQTITGGSNWKMVACGYDHSAAIKTDGTLWLWGRNDWGQLGDNTNTHKSSPVQTVATGSNWKSVSCATYTAAIKIDGSLWVWGANIWGQLGDNTTTYRSSPVQTISGGTNWKSVSCGTVHMAAIKTDGTLWTWGANAAGNLGDNTTTGKSSPVQTVAGGANWASISCRQACMAAIKTDGSLWMWGSNNFGQLGDTTMVNKSSPIQTISGGTNWKSVACGDYHATAIKTDGTLWSWGRDTYGQLGDNSTTHKSSPVQTVAGGTNWKSIACGWGHTVAIQINNINTTGAE